MTKQLLIYETAVPLSAGRHADLSLEPVSSYGFSGAVNAMPLMAVELVRAATEYAVVFTASDDHVMPAVVLGVKSDQNLFLAADGRWSAKYIPAFLRRYPFVFSSTADGKTLTLCIDETHPGVNREGRGERLFGDDRKPSPYTENVLRFLQDYQQQFERTRLFGRRLKELDLLEPMQAQITTPEGGKLQLGGFLAVSREKLRALKGDALEMLCRTDELELIYLHLYSMRNFDDVKSRLVGAMRATGAVATEPA